MRTMELQSAGSFVPYYHCIHMPADFVGIVQPNLSLSYKTLTEDLRCRFCDVALPKSIDGSLIVTFNVYHDSAIDGQHIAYNIVCSRQIVRV
jgi:hypothetical protein